MVESDWSCIIRNFRYTLSLESGAANRDRVEHDCYYRWTRGGGEKFRCKTIVAATRVFIFGYRRDVSLRHTGMLATRCPA